MRASLRRRFANWQTYGNVGQSSPGNRDGHSWKADTMKALTPAGTQAESRPHDPTVGVHPRPEAHMVAVEIRA